MTMGGFRRGERRAALAVVSACAALFASSPARASSINASGQLVFDKDALMTFGFESLSDAEGVGASWLAWSTGSTVGLTPSAVTMAAWQSALVSGSDALEGHYALRLDATAGPVGLGLLDKTLFDSIVGQRVVVSMWGRSNGAEPELDIVYPSFDEPYGPSGLVHIVAIRTGNETSDGWVEYSTGPIDGAVWSDGIAAIILTARYATTDETLALDSPSFFPGAGGPAILDTSGYALVDAVEVLPTSGAPMAATSCTQATVQATCGDLGECFFGHCVDGTALWGPVPGLADHRRDLVQRWEFIAENLGADRHAASLAPSIFLPATLATIESATTPRAFFGAMAELVADLREGHTHFGEPPSSRAFASSCQTTPPPSRAGGPSFLEA